MMTWQEIRAHYPSLWLTVEALNGRTANGERILDKLSVIQAFQDPKRAMKLYAQLRRKNPGREFYVFHTDAQTANPDAMFDLWRMR
ncbi:MAG: hypothetical protein ACPG8W_23265 [Candidatus Promineifilaceae bacterium]